MGPVVLVMLVAFAAVGFTMIVRLHRNPKIGVRLGMTAWRLAIPFGFAFGLIVLSIILVRWVL